MFSNASLYRFALLVFAALAITPVAVAQSATAEIDFAVGYGTNAQHSVQGSSFWQKGGFAELSVAARRGLGIAALVKGGAATNVNNSGVNIDTVTTVFGPRYTLHRRRLTVFGEGLIGESNGFNGVYPSSQGALSSTNSFASLLQGGIDVAFDRHLAIRVVQAGWQRTQFPNAGTNVQNTLTLGAGICFRSRR